MHNPDDYRHQKKELLEIINKTEGGITAQNIAFLASVIGVPLTVMYIFIAEDMPEYEQFAKENIERINKFYGN